MILLSFDISCSSWHLPAPPAGLRAMWSDLGPSKAVAKSHFQRRLGSGAGKKGLEGNLERNSFFWKNTNGDFFGKNPSEKSGESSDFSGSGRCTSTRGRRQSVLSSEFLLLFDDLWFFWWPFKAFIFFEAGQKVSGLKKAAASNWLLRSGWFSSFTRHCGIPVELWPHLDQDRIWHLGNRS